MASPASDAELLEALKAKLLRLAAGHFDDPLLPRPMDGSDLDVIAFLTDTAIEEIAHLSAEQARAKVESAEFTARLRETQRHARIGTWEWTPATGATQWSDEHYELLGLTPGSPATLDTLLDLIHPEDRPRAAEIRSRDLSGDDLPQPLQYRIVTPQGETRHVYSESIRRTIDGDGRLVFGGILQDVTTRVAGEARLRAAEKMEAMGRLAGGVAHDFNNLLTVIEVHAAFLRDDLRAGQGDIDDVEQILTAARRAAAPTGQLLAFGRRQLLRPQPTDVAKTLGELNEMLARLLGESIAIELRLTDDDAVVSVAPGQLEQVVVNLAINARDAMPTGGRLSIRCEVVLLDDIAAAPLACAPGEYVQILVEDTGQGIDPTTLEHIFEPFFSTKGDDGTGLGLATAHGIVHQAGGHIRATSEPGVGTAVWVLLPRTHAPATVSLDLPVDPTIDGRGLRVLLVEDEEGVRRATASVLRNAGFAVEEARDGPEALRAAFDSVDLLLSDVVMPGISGVELGRLVKERRPDIPILFMSGYTDDETLRYGLTHGETRLITKPFTPEELVRRVWQAIEESR